MPKVPESVAVAFTISNIRLEVPRSFLDEAALRAAVFVGRQGKSAATRRTKWFTVTDPSRVPLSTPGPAAAADAPNGGEHVIGADSSQTNQPVPAGGLAMLEYSGINDVVYQVEMHPLNIFEGDWVFDQKVTHPLTLFAKVLSIPRDGAKPAGTRSEQESNFHEMLQMDQDEMEEDADHEGAESGHDHFSDSDDANPEDASQTSMSGQGLTVEQMAALNGSVDPNERLGRNLITGKGCKKRYLPFPKEIDLSKVVNTKSKTMDYRARLNSKSVGLLGSTLSFTIKAELPMEVLHRYEDKVKSKEEKAESKRREKEEKVLEKERHRQEKEEKKRVKEEQKKDGKSKKEYGEDITNMEHGAVTPPTETEHHEADHKGEDGIRRKSISAFNAIKSIFGGKGDKAEKTTPFSIKLDSTPYPYLIVLDNFRLSKLIMAPENYRAVHIRLGCDDSSIDEFPRLLLDAAKPSVAREKTIVWYDGQPRNVTELDFAGDHIYFGDKNIRHVTGFDTIRALQEHEKKYHEALAAGPRSRNATPPHRSPESNALFHEQLLNVGEKFSPVAFEPTKYSCNDNQAIATKYTRVTAQLIVATYPVGEKMKSDEEQKKAYIKMLKKEEQRKAKAARRASKASTAENAEGAENSQSISQTDPSSQSVNEHPNPTKEGSGEAEGASDTAAAAAAENPAAEAAEKKPEEEAEKKPEEEAEKKPEEEAEKKSEEEEGEKKEKDFESGAHDHTEAKKEVPRSDASQLIVNKTSSFQLGTYMINEEYVPTEGIAYRITFVTGEELSFRARRIFIPSVCHFGNSAASTDVEISHFDPNAPLSAP